MALTADQFLDFQEEKPLRNVDAFLDTPIGSDEFLNEAPRPAPRADSFLDEPELPRNVAGQPIYPPTTPAKSFLKGAPGAFLEAQKEFLIDKPREAAPVVRGALADIVAPSRGDIEAEAFRTGKVPYGKILGRTAAETIPELIPMTPVEIAVAAALGKGVSVAAQKFPILRTPISKIGKMAKDFITTKKVKIPFSSEDLANFTKFSEQTLEPEVQTFFKGLTGKARADILRAGIGGEVTTRVPRFRAIKPRIEPKGPAPVPEALPESIEPPQIRPPVAEPPPGRIARPPIQPPRDLSVPELAKPTTKGKTFFHGTHADFKSFEQQGNRGSESVDMGFHFGSKETANKAVANRKLVEEQGRIGLSFAKGIDVSKPRVIEAELDIKNPIRLKEERGGNWSPTDVIRKIRNKLEDGEIPGISQEDTDLLFEDEMIQDGENIFDIDDVRAESEALQKWLDARGYDGIVYENTFEGGGDSYIAFKPEQIITRGPVRPPESELADVAGEEPTAIEEGLDLPPEPVELEAGIEFTHQQVAKIMAKELTAGDITPGGLIRQQGEFGPVSGEVTGAFKTVSTNPDWYKQMGAQNSQDVITALEKFSRRDVLTPKQTDIVNLAFETDARINQEEPPVLDFRTKADVEAERGAVSAAERAAKPIKGRKVEAVVKEVTGFKPFAPKTITEPKALKRLFKRQEEVSKKVFKAGRKEGFEVGFEKGEDKSAKAILDRRRARLRAIREEHGMTDLDLRKVSGKDIRLMDNYEFKKYLDDIDAKAITFEERRDLKLKIASELHEKEFEKVDNLREYLKLPSIEKMDAGQLTRFNEALEEFQKGDEFLSLRKLETVDNTELKGIRTVREAKEILGKKLGVSVEDLGKIEVGPIDKFKFDTALAEKNPFYKLLVDDTNTSLIDSEQKFYEMETEVDDLTSKARASRKRKLSEKLIPTDELVFEYLGAKDKAPVAAKMTKEEIDLAGYLQQRFAQFRDYLVQQGTMDKYREDYITHIRRDFLEAWKDDGILDAMKEVITQAREDAAVFKILEDDTQNILPLEKFFQFAMRRSGELKPSQNVAKAFKAYSGAILKKQALDKIMPSLDIYAYSLSPKARTPRGLEMDRRLIKFVREWVNNKKGRRTSLGGILPQGGAVDLGLRATNALITMIDLGLNIPVGLASTVGEQVTSYVNLGSKQYTLGLKRMASAKGRKIIEANRGFVGKSLWKELTDASKNIGDQFSTGLYGLFNIATTTANKVHLLGSLTPEEWAAGEISTERKADLTREMGRFRHVQGSKSIFGATSAGSALTKYKTWALPIFRTVTSDIAKLTKMAGEGDFKKASQSKEFQELLRATLATATIGLAGKVMIGDEDEKDKGFISELTSKVYRESLTILGAIDPTVLSSVRLLSFLGDLAKSIKQIIKLETYKTKPGLKGAAKLKRTVTPRVLKQIFRSEEKPDKVPKWKKLKFTRGYKGKPLSQQAATAILKEAKGDKDLARQIARKEGFEIA